MDKAIIDNYEGLRQGAEREYRRVSGEERIVIWIGMATCGRSAGAREVFSSFQEALTKYSLEAEVVQVGCYGHCYAEPMAIISKPGWPPIVYGYLTPNRAEVIVKNFLSGEDPCLEWALGATVESEMVPSIYDTPRFGQEHRYLLKRCGTIDPENIYHYLAEGGYKGLLCAFGMSSEKIVEEVKKSGLRGLGGGGFPTWRKWDLCRQAPGTPKYVIGNGDEGDPGAFMDRTIMESDPQSIIEGMVIAGYALSSSSGYIYVRGEYPLAVARLMTAVRQAEEVGLLGKDILGSGFDFSLEIMQGASAFVCGESSALMYSLEGKRGMPRVRPPRSVEAGLWGKPTLLNNVKTYASIPRILVEGGDRFAQVGTEGSKGTAVFALAGKIRKTGLVEVAMGTTLRELIFTIGGGVPALKKESEAAGVPPKVVEKRFKAVQIGGPSGGCLPESILDTPIDFDALTEAGAMMGSGGMVILDEDNCVVEAARYFLEFTQKESCGKCTFCRIGTKQMLEILTDITRGEGKLEELDLLQELGEDIKRGSLCNLGKTAPNPILTTLSYFRQEYEAHILEKRCPALECKELTAHYIVLDKCQRACDACVGSCPTEAIYTRKDRLKAIDQEKCVRCQSCIDACPPQYDAVIKVSPLSALPESEPREEETGLKIGRLKD